MSQRFLNLIRKGETAEVAAAADENPSIITSRDAQGVSALLLSVYHHQNLIRDFLLSRLGELDLFEAAAAGNCETLAACLRENAMGIHETSPDGWGALHLAAAFGGSAATALLVEHGAHLHKVSHNPLRSQPLHAALALGQDVGTVRYLVAQGANVNAVQAGGFAPLHQAAAAGSAELVLLLLGAGADPQALTDRGQTPQAYARERGHSEIAELLGGK